MLQVKQESRLRKRSVPWWALSLAIAAPVVAQDRTPQQRLDDATIDHAIELYVSNDAFQAQYVRTLDLGEIGETEARLGFFYNEDRDLIGMGDLLALVGDEVNVRSLELRVGTRVYGAFLAAEDEDVFGVGLGGEATYYFGNTRRTSVSLGAFYAPDIMTFGQADNVKDVSLRLMTRLGNETDVFVGVRSFEIDLPIDREVDDNLHVGFRRSF
jgi:hypothetical protein